MADPDLNESAWQRAKDDAWAVVKAPIFGIGGAIVALLFGAAALIASEGQPVATQAATSIFFGVLSVGITLVFIFLVQLAAAPVRQRNALRQAWNRPEPEPESVQPVNVALSLSDLRRKGEDLRISFRNGHDAEGEEAVEIWTREAIQFLSQHCDAAAAKEFIDASRYEELFIPALEARINALDRIISKLG